MIEKELNLDDQEEEIELEFEEETLNPDDAEDDFEIEEDDTATVEISDDEKEKIALEVHNKKTGKNYKTWDDVVKSEKQRDIAFAQNPPKKKEDVVETIVEQPVAVAGGQLDSETLDALLLTTFPDLRNAPETLAELKEISQLRKESPISVMNKSDYLKNRAKGESSEHSEVEATRKRVTSPSGVVIEKRTIKVTKEDVRIADKFFQGDVKRYLKYKASQK